MARTDITRGKAKRRKAARAARTGRIRVRRNESARDARMDPRTRELHERIDAAIAAGQQLRANIERRIDEALREDDRRGDRDR